MEDFENNEYVAWEYACETYTLTEENGITNFEIYVDITIAEFKIMHKMLDVSLKVLKELSEKN